MVWLRLTSQPGVWRTRLVFLIRCEVPSGTLLTPVGVCLVSPFVPPTRCSWADAARAALPPVQRGPPSRPLGTPLAHPGEQRARVARHQPHLVTGLLDGV